MGSISVDNAENSHIFLNRKNCILKKEILASWQLHCYVSKYEKGQNSEPRPPQNWYWRPTPGNRNVRSAKLSTEIYLKGWQIFTKLSLALLKFLIKILFKDSILSDFVYVEICQIL